MAKKRFVPAGLALLLLASCAPYTARLQLDTLNQTVPSGSLFCQRLAVEYRDLSDPSLPDTSLVFALFHPATREQAEGDAK